MPADSLAKARTPEPRGKGGRNWITKLKPGNRGELPAYIQHIVKALIEKRGMPERQAYAIAMSRPDAWLKSKHTDTGTKAASALAKGQLEKDKAINRLKRAGRAVATAAGVETIRPRVGDLAAIFEAECERVEAIEEAIGPDVLDAALGRVQFMEGLALSPREHALDLLAEDAATALTLIEATRVRELGTGKFHNYAKRLTDAPAATNCPNCGALKLPDKMCPSCEAPTAGKQMSMAEAAAFVIEEAELDTKERKALPKSAFAIPEKAPGAGSYPIHDRKHAIDALARSAGKPEAARVKAAVAKRYPDLGKAQESAGQKRVHAPFSISHRGKTLRGHATSSGWAPADDATRKHLAGLDRPTRKHTEGRMRRAAEVAHGNASGKLREDAADGDPAELKAAGGHVSTLARVKSLKLGETARIPSGHAITHYATPDGRKAWRADTPSKWSSSGWSLGDEHRTPEGAVKEAFEKSAGSNDPASLGGATRYHSYSRVSVGGKEHRFVGVRPHDAKPEVRDISGVGQPGSIKVVGWDELHPPDDIMQQQVGSPLDSMLDARLLEAARGRRDTISAIAGKGGPKDTMDFHRKGGKFSKGRAAIHGGMIRHVLDNPRAHDSGPVAMVATRSRSGGPVNTVKGAGAAVPHGAVHISIPAMRERIPEHAALKAHATADEKATTDREARHVAKTAATMALMRGHAVVIHDDPDSGADGHADVVASATRAAGAMRRAAQGAA